MCTIKYSMQTGRVTHRYSNWSFHHALLHILLIILFLRIVSIASVLPTLLLLVLLFLFLFFVFVFVFESGDYREVSCLFSKGTFAAGCVSVSVSGSSKPVSNSLILLIILCTSSSLEYQGPDLNVTVPSSWLPHVYPQVCREFLGYSRWHLRPIRRIISLSSGLDHYYEDSSMLNSILVRQC